MYPCEQMESGFTLVELVSILAINGILMIAFATILIINEDNSATLLRRLNIHNDMQIFDTYINKNLLSTISDSVFIYIDSTAEQAGIYSNTGKILVMKDNVGNSFRITSINNQLWWEKNNDISTPLTSVAQSLTFSKSMPLNQNYVEMAVTLVNATDSLRYVKSFTSRN